MSTDARPLWQLMLDAAQKRPLSCEECFVLFEYLADFLPRDENGFVPEALQRAVDRYLSSCPDCRDYYWQRLMEMEAIQKRKGAT